MNNSTSIRFFLRELLRRLDFPRVILEPNTDADRTAYFAALEAPTVATSNRSWTSGAAASPTPKRRKPEQIFDSQKP